MQSASLHLFTELDRYHVNLSMAPEHFCLIPEIQNSPIDDRLIFDEGLWFRLKFQYLNFQHENPIIDPSSGQKCPAKIQ